MVHDNLKQENLVPPITYQPKYSENQIVKFTRYVERKYGITLGNYWELQKWSCEKFPEFWECLWEYFNIKCSQPYTQVFDRNRSFDNMEWFKGARLNYTENVFKHRDSHTALIATDEKDRTETFTYDRLYGEVCQYSRALEDVGIKKGDTVACCMSNKVEAVLAFLAVASIGAIWCGALPLLGAKAVLARFQQVSPKVLFASGDFVFDGKQIKMIEKLRRLVSELGTLEKVIFIPSKSEEFEDFRSIPRCCSVSEFLEASRRQYQKQLWDMKYEQVPFDYPLSIDFTSGTTGQPKELVHSQGAFVSSIRDFGIHQDITRKDVLINFSPVGWISWNMFVNTLHLGMTLVLYEGSNPFEESRFWDLVDKFGITSCYMWSSSAELMERKGDLPTEKHKLTTLKQVFPLGSVMKPHTYDFFKRIRPGMFVDSVYGTTEVYGIIGGLDSNLPVYKGEIQCFSLGMDVRCLDDKGNEVIGERGNLVIANPCPSMPISVWKDRNKQRIRETYLYQFPGYWCVGDEVWINPVTKGFIVYGRCDETMNPKGARFSCSEIYFALENFPGLLDSICVSQFNAERDERVILFVKMMPGHDLTETVKEAIKATIEKTLTYEHVPDIVMQVPDVPYNLTGKKLTILVKKLINKIPISNAEFVVNPETVDYFTNLDLGDF